jgi:hypothetical protein
MCELSYIVRLVQSLLARSMATFARWIMAYPPGTKLVSGGRTISTECDR